MSRTILMITHWYPPCLAWPSAAARVHGLATGLARIGWTPVVVAPSLATAGLCDCVSCRAGAGPSAVHDEEVHAIPVRPRATYRAWRTLVGRRGGPAADRPGTERTLDVARMLVESRAAWIGPTIRHAAMLADDRAFDAVWTTSGPFEATIVGRTLQARLGIPWVADLRDPISAPAGSSVLASRLRRSLNRPHVRRLRYADAVVAATEASAAVDERLLRRPIHTVRSGFDPEAWAPVHGAPSQIHTAGRDAPLHVLYAGALYPGIVDPDALLRGLRRARDRGATAVLDYYGSAGDYLLSRARHLGVAESVVDHGRVPAEEIRSVMAAADAAVLIEPTRPDAATRIPGKLYEYLAARRPLLVTPGHHPAVAAAIRSTGCGRLAEDEEQIASVLLDWAQERKEHGRPLDRSDGMAVERYSIHHRAEELGAILDRAIGR